MSPGVPAYDAAGLAVRAAHARNTVGPLVRAAFDVDVHGIDRIPVRGPVIIAASHPGEADALVLIATMPRPVQVMVDAPAGRLRAGSVAAVAGGIVVADGTTGRDALRQALAVLGEAGAVAIFPEGGVADGSVAAARPGIAYVAARSGAPVIPVAIIGSTGARPRVGRRRARVEVRVGVPLALPAVDDPMSRAELGLLAERIRQGLADHIRASADRSVVGAQGRVS